MIVLDTSAVVALLLREPRAAAIATLIDSTPVPHMSAVTAFELRIVMRRRLGDHGVREADLFLAETDVAVVAFDADQAALASRAYARFGKGSGHPAQLNLGDCAAYALAKSMDLPLLYVGEDFARTDITSAL